MIQYILLLVALSPVVFLIGLVKPKWILFWVKEPNRLYASSVGLFLFMASFSYYSELRVQHRAQQEQSVEGKKKTHEQTNDLHLDTAR